MTNPFSIIVAYARISRAIGYRTLQPWPRLPTDLKRFAQLTTPHTLIVGRKTFVSPDYGGRALPNRRNIVLSKDASWTPPSGAVHASDWHEALQLSDPAFGGRGYDNGAELVSPDGTRAPYRHVFVVGGASVYAQALLHPHCAWTFATEVEGDWPGDAFFPQLDHNWARVPTEHCPAGWANDSVFENNGIQFSFVTYHRTTSADATTLDTNAS